MYLLQFDEDLWGLRIGQYCKADYYGAREQAQEGSLVSFCACLSLPKILFPFINTLIRIF